MPTAAIADESLARLLAPAQPIPQRRATDRTARWIEFELDKQHYGVEVASVMEVLEPEMICPVPGAKPQVQGVINLRGQIVTVVDLRAQLGAPAGPPSGRGRILVLDAKPHPLGVVVDAVAEVVEIPGSAIERAPKVNDQMASAAVVSLARVGSKTLLLIDARRLVDACVQA